MLIHSIDRCGAITRVLFRPLRPAWLLQEARS